MSITDDDAERLEIAHPTNWDSNLTQIESEIRQYQGKPVEERIKKADRLIDRLNANHSRMAEDQQRVLAAGLSDEDYRALLARIREIKPRIAALAEDRPPLTTEQRLQETAEALGWTREQERTALVEFVDSGRQDLDDYLLETRMRLTGPHSFTVTVEGCTYDEAVDVMKDRIDRRDPGPHGYRIGWER